MGPRLPLAPSPPTRRPLGHLRERGRDPLRLFGESQACFGDIVRYRMAYVHVEQLTHPDFVRHVLVDAKDQYGKGASWDKTRPLIGLGLVTAEGDLWRQQRRLAQPAFHTAQLARLCTVMTDAIAEQLTGWEQPARDGTPVLVFHEMRALTLRVVIRALFGTELDQDLPRISADFTAALEVTNDRILSPLPYVRRLYRVPTPANRRFSRHYAALDRVVSAIIARRTAAAGQSGDLLDLLLSASTTDLGRVDQAQLRDEVMTLLLAGFETTSNALAWALDLLQDHPEAAQRLQAEADRVLAGRTPTADDLPALVYTRAVVEEVLRLRPPLWAIPREALREDEVGGYRIPKGDIVTLVPYVTHRHPEFWTEPEAFDPERFLPERRRTIVRGAYFPFGLGQRQCLGLHFALTEATLALAMVGARFDLERIGESPPQDVYVTLRPGTAVPMRVVLRAPVYA